MFFLEQKKSFESLRDQDQFKAFLSGYKNCIFTFAGAGGGDEGNHLGMDAEQR